MPPEAASSEIITASGVRYRISRIVAVDEKTSIVRASLVNRPENIDPLPSSTFSIQSGDAVLIITGDARAAREIRGFVTATDRDVQKTFRVAVAAALPPDSIGSPIINGKGQVVGVVISTTADGQNCTANLIETVRSLYPQGAGFQTTGPAKEDSPGGSVDRGGGVRQGVAIRRVAPAYPQIAKAMRVDGTIVFEVLVAENGDVISAKPISIKLRCHIEGKEVAPEAEAALIQAALNSILQWKFAPTTKNGEPIKVRGTIPVNFNL
jgi:hypothetical protein